MQFYSSLEAVPAEFGPSAVTIGKFDGVHAGHRRVLTELRSAAEEAGLVSTVLTFDRHPLALLRPELCPPALTSNAQKREILEGTGIGAMVMIEFTESFSLQTPEEFVENVLVGILHARIVFVGPDFRFGRQGLGTVDLLGKLGAQYGFEVRTISAVQPDGQRSISSTWIRDLLAEGRVGEAAVLLERRPSVRGMVVRGEQRGRQLGFPTANLSSDLEGLIPADGVYAAFATVDGRTMPAAASVGNNPTFVGVPDKQVEAHILDETLDLYGKTLEVSFVEYIRGMAKFDSVEALVAQMSDDEAKVREVLGVPQRRTVGS
jgi:riboflavin kinase/FMN adenylyltransferase